jgi:hypothetical protein
MPVADTARQKRRTAGSVEARERPVAAPRLALGTATIQFMQETEPSRSSAPTAPRPDLHADESRLLMMRRVKAMTVEQRLQLFERLSRDAAWIRSAAKRIR